MLRIVEGSFVQGDGNSDASHSHIVGLLNAMTIDDVEGPAVEEPAESRGRAAPNQGADA